MGWTLDVQVESTPLITTGGHTWKAAYRLADFLSEMAPQLGLTQQGVSVLELGAGAGWLGVTLARNLPHAALVCLTEQEGGLGWLRHNVEISREKKLPLGHVQVQACDWREYAGGPAEPNRGPAEGGGQQSGTEDANLAGLRLGCKEQAEPSMQPGAVEEGAAKGAGAQVSPPTGTAEQEPPLDLRSVQWDFIIGSDLIYNEVGSRCLPRVLAALAGPATVCLYSHTKHRFDLLDWEFFSELAACSMRCEEVWEQSARAPPDSPPPEGPVPTDLFPDQRIAIYRITKQA